MRDGSAARRLGRVRVRHPGRSQGPGRERELDALGPRCATSKTAACACSPSSARPASGRRAPSRSSCAAACPPTACCGAVAPSSSARRRSGRVRVLRGVPARAMRRRCARSWPGTPRRSAGWPARDQPAVDVAPADVDDPQARFHLFDGVTSFLQRHARPRRSSWCSRTSTGPTTRRAAPARVRRARGPRRVAPDRRHVP